MSRSMGPSALQETLAAMGLKLIKTENNRINMGKSPELVVCERLTIKPREVPAKWETRGNVEMSAAPMPETPMKGPQ